MPKTKRTKAAKKTNEGARRPAALGARPLVVTMGCPSGVGPEVALAAALEKGAPPVVLVGDRGALERAAQSLGVAPRRLARIEIVEPTAPLAPADREPGRPSAAGGRAQLEFIEAGYRLAREKELPLVTGPVSKEAIARSGLRRAARFRGHTEWLEEMDGARHSVMCFASEKLVTSLVTTHLPLARVPRALTVEGVLASILELADLVLRLGRARPKIAVCSLNPHAGEGELLGTEETRAIVPALERARAILGRRVELSGPVGAETAYRKGAQGGYDAVVAMYHDQATIPMKLLDFGGAVNVTQGLSIVRTSVDHGTAYDIAGRGIADPRGMREALRVAERLGAAKRRVDVP